MKRTGRYWFLPLMLALSAGDLGAQSNGLGVFFDDHIFTDATTNRIADGDPFALYIVLLASEFDSISGYECSLEFNGAPPTVLGASGPAGSGWLNHGDPTNHLVLFATAQPAVGGAVVLGIVDLAVSSPGLVEILLGPSSPASIPGVPVVRNGLDVDDVADCVLTSGDEIPGVVATINGAGITPVANRTWTQIKVLFD